MAENKLSLAIFDFDGTLTEGHLWYGIAKHHREKRVKRRKVFLYMGTHLPWWIAAKLKIISNDRNKIKWGEDLSCLFKGFTIEEARKVFEWVTDNYFMPLMRADIIQELKNHRSQGQKVMLLSGMFVDFLEVVGKRLDADYVVGTQLEKNHNAYTGRIIPPLCFGENKALLLKRFIQQKQLNVDLGSSSAYADSISDASVFHLVGHPVATYPDRELALLAERQKWKVIGR